MTNAQKQVRLNYDMQMSPNCHPDKHFKVLYRPMRGGDHIIIKCSECYREFFDIKCPKEHE